MKGSGRGPGGKRREEAAFFLRTNNAPRATANRRHAVERAMSTMEVLSMGPN